MKLAPQSLRSASVWLEPLSAENQAELVELALAHPRVFAHFPYLMTTRGDVERVLAQGIQLQAEGLATVFLTREADSHRLCGSTSIRLIEPKTPSVEIGATWLVPERQRTAVNTAAKTLQLEHAFERLGVERVVLRTDVNNTRSQDAIARLGATREGVLRAEMRRADGSLRDTVIYSLLRSEWPRVKDHLLVLQSRWQQNAPAA